MIAVRKYYFMVTVAALTATTALGAAPASAQLIDGTAQTSVMTSVETKAAPRATATLHD